jgi:hypothetical protein
LMFAAFNDQTVSLVYSVLMVIGGLWFLRASSSRGLRQRRADPEDPPVVRSDGTDRLIKIACFCLGAPMLIAGLLVTFLLLFARD